MSLVVYFVVIFLCLGFMDQEANGAYMEKLAKKKLCADDECICKFARDVNFNVLFFRMMLLGLYILWDR